MSRRRGEPSARRSGGDGGPPKLARALLERLLPPGDPGTVTGDLDEEYVRFVLPAKGRRGANRWYWRQVLLSAPRIVIARVSEGGGAVLGASSWLSDLRFGARVLRRRPGFTVATVATLALGLGVNTTVFSVVDAVLVRPLPFDAPERLVRPIPDQLFFMEASEAQRLGERMTTFESFAAWGRTLFLFTGAGEAEEVRGARVAWNHFDVLGTAPMLGRGFERADAESDDVIILSHGLWMRRFGGDPSIVGRTVELNGGNVTVIGVMGPDHVPMEYDWQAWRTLPLDPALAAGSGLAGNARLRPGVGIEQARDELRRVLPEIWAEGGYNSPEEERAALELVPLSDWLIGDVRGPLLLLSGAVGLLLLLACANVSNLLLAEAGGRAQEFAVRSALGGGLLRVARQRIIEVLLLSVAGGVVALAASALTLGWFVARLPADLPRAGHVSISGTVLTFTTVCTLLTAVVTGLLPVLRLSRSGGGSLSTSSRGSSRDREHGRARSALVAAEMALAVVLVAGAGLMVRTLSSLRSVDPGFDSVGVVTVRPAPPSARYAGARLESYYEQVSEALTALPGVSAVGAIQFLPMTPGGWWTSYRPEGLALAEGENEPNTAMRVVRGDYFKAMRIELLEGRVLAPSDGAEEAPTVAVVNRTFSREAFPTTSALDRIVWMDGTEVRIVGVVGDVRQSDLRTESQAEMYVPFGKVPWQRMHVVVRGTDGVAPTSAAVAAAVRSVDPRVALLGPRPMEEVVGTTFSDTTLLSALLGLFGLVGLALGAVGVYGVTVQSVSERRREIGIRIALGAEANGVVRRTVTRGMRPVIVGVALGWVCAASGARLMEGLLFGVRPVDPRTFAAAPSVLVLTALCALLLPALRASRVDPARTLRQD